MTKTIYPSTTRREVSFDGLVLGTRRGRARALDTGAEEGVFPKRKRRSSSRRFDFSILTSSLSSKDASANSPSTSMTSRHRPKDAYSSFLPPYAQGRSAAGSECDGGVPSGVRRLVHQGTWVWARGGRRGRDGGRGRRAWNWVGRDVGVSIGCGSLWTSSLRSFPVPLLLLLLLLLDGNSHARRGQARLLVCQTAEDVGVTAGVHCFCRFLIASIVLVRHCRTV